MTPEIKELLEEIYDWLLELDTEDGEDAIIEYTVILPKVGIALGKLKECEACQGIGLEPQTGREYQTCQGEGTIEVGA